jgi:acyl carrier protein
VNSKYKTLIKKVLKYGTKQEGRNGNTLIVPHYSFTLDLGSNVSHICTLRKMYYKGVEGEFEDMETGKLYADSVIREHFTWDSINALIFIAHINVEYDVVISADDLVKSITVKNLYDLVSSKAIAA